MHRTIPQRRQPPARPTAAVNPLRGSSAPLRPLRGDCHGWPCGTLLSASRKAGRSSTEARAGFGSRSVVAAKRRRRTQERGHEEGACNRGGVHTRPQALLLLLRRRARIDVLTDAGRGGGTPGVQPSPTPLDGPRKGSLFTWPQGSLFWLPFPGLRVSEVLPGRGQQVDADHGDRQDDRVREHDGEEHERQAGEPDGRRLQKGHRRVHDGRQCGQGSSPDSGDDPIVGSTQHRKDGHHDRAGQNGRYQHRRRDVPPAKKSSPQIGMGEPRTYGPVAVRENGATPSGVASSRASATFPLRFGPPGDATPAAVDGLDIAGSGASGQELTGARVRRRTC